MKVLATLERAVKGDRISSWKFCSDAAGSQFWASSSAGKRIRCSDIEDLRRVYSKMRAWGFAPMLDVVA